MSKPVNLTPEEIETRRAKKEEEELQSYLKGRPNRQEVSNYVNGLLEEKYFPEIEKMVQSSQKAMQLGLMILQSLLIEKGVVTKEDIESLTEEYIRKFSEEIELQENHENSTE